MDKLELRRQLKARRNAFTQAQQQKSSALVCGHILASEHYHNAQAILGYLAFGRELSVDAVLEQALKDGKKVYVPYITSDTEFQAVRLTDMVNFELDRYGIRSLKKVGEIINPANLDLVLVPAVAYAKDGNRLGMGAGYYDRFLLGCPKATKLGLAYEALLQEYLPTDAYDIPIGYLVTESGIINTRL